MTSHRVIPEWPEGIPSNLSPYGGIFGAPQLNEIYAMLGFLASPPYFSVGTKDDVSGLADATIVEMVPEFDYAAIQADSAAFPADELTVGAVGFNIGDSNYVEVLEGFEGYYAPWAYGVFSSANLDYAEVLVRHSKTEYANTWTRVGNGGAGLIYVNISGPPQPLLAGDGFRMEVRANVSSGTTTLTEWAYGAVWVGGLEPGLRGHPR